jgi:hypothetical protein
MRNASASRSALRITMLAHNICCQNSYETARRVHSGRPKASMASFTRA